MIIHIYNIYIIYIANYRISWQSRYGSIIMYTNEHAASVYNNIGTLRATTALD